MKLSIITVSYKVKDLLMENLACIFKNTSGFDFEVFVVDNDSGDGSVEMVKNEFPQAKLIANNKNVGFAAANNIAIKQAKGEYILLLNPDMRIFPDTLAKMLSWMEEHPQAGIASCKLVDGNEEIIPHVRRFPRFWEQSAIALKLPRIFPGILNKYILKNFDYDNEAEVDSVRGSFFMIRKEVIEELGGLDERYFIWFEEVDYCKQAKKAGWKVMYTPVPRCLDYVGKSFVQVPKGKTQKYFRDSMLKYFRKWHPAWQYWILKLLWVPGLLIVYINNNLKKKY